MIELREWMSKPVICVKPEDTALHAVKKMIKHGIGCVVVEDKNNKVHGILTERDILKKVIVKQKNIKSVLVKNIMTKNVKTASVNSNVLQVLNIMKKGKFRDIPITEDSKVVGIITSNDLIKMFAV